jgi:hypothetical protein
MTAFPFAEVQLRVLNDGRWRVVDIGFCGQVFDHTRERISIWPLLSAISVIKLFHCVRNMRA